MSIYVPGISTRTTGLKAIINGFQQYKKTEGRKFAANVLKAGRYIQRQSMKIVPVDTGALKSSAFTVREGEGFASYVTVGYGGWDTEASEYAVYVHEDLDAMHGEVYNMFYKKRIKAGEDHPRGPKQQAKFLEAVLRRSMGTILDIILFGKKSLT